MKLRLLICDLDGTLVNSLDDLVTSSNLLLAAYGSSALPAEAIRPCIGKGVEYLVSGVLGAAGCTRFDLETAVAQYREIYAAHALDQTGLYPGVQETLAALQGRSAQLQMAVVSNKPELATRGILSALGIAEFFTLVAGGDTFPEMKPSPLPLRKVMEQLQAMPEDCAIIGDSVYDLQAGKAAGVRTIAALYGFQSPEMLKALKPDYTVSAFSEILSIV